GGGGGGGGGASQFGSLSGFGASGGGGGGAGVNGRGGETLLGSGHDGQQGARYDGFDGQPRGNANAPSASSLAAAGGEGGGGGRPYDSSLPSGRQPDADGRGGGGGGGGGAARDPSGSTAGVETGAGGGGGGGSGIPGLMTAEEALRNVTKPYPYAQSYHFLVKHLKSRFEKNDILRIIRALATFRPSLIALQMPLTEEDEIFVERTFQRTLVELHKLISFSGTPTVVWRRTGEICLVGTEFCLLTGWKREELVGSGSTAVGSTSGLGGVSGDQGTVSRGGGRIGGGKYIFELFDTSSVVEYFESFAKHAFESTSTSVTLQCVVLGPDGRPVPCAFCFSVRRDLFSCPSLVIGSFLPLLM
ncbi:hypothetical protein JCM10212_003234, partial [Sporobolomyces blumeae]